MSRRQSSLLRRVREAAKAIDRVEEEPRWDPQRTRRLPSLVWANYMDAYREWLDAVSPRRSA